MSTMHETEAESPISSTFTAAVNVIKGLPKNGNFFLLLLLLTAVTTYLCKNNFQF